MLIPDQGSDSRCNAGSVSTDSIEDSLDVLYTQGSVIIGLVMIFLTIVAVFTADRVVRPLHQIADHDRECKVQGMRRCFACGYIYRNEKVSAEAINKMMGRLKVLDDSGKNLYPMYLMN